MKTGLLANFPAEMQQNQINTAVSGKTQPLKPLPFKVTQKLEEENKQPTSCCMRIKIHSLVASLVELHNLDQFCINA